MEITDIFHLSLIGISQGCGYALVAIGFVFIYRATEVINFAHGELMMLGSFMVVTFYQILGLNFLLSVVLAVLSLGAFGYLLDFAVMRRVVGEAQTSIFILTVAIGLVIKAAVGMSWGWGTRTLDIPFQADFNVGGVIVGLDRLNLLMWTAIDVSWDMETMPVKGRSLIGAIRDIDGQCLSLLYTQDWTKIAVVYPEGRTCRAIAKIMCGRIVGKRDATLDPLYQVC